jgi:hypothetical protein
MAGHKRSRGPSQRVKRGRGRGARKGSLRAGVEKLPVIQEGGWRRTIIEESDFAPGMPAAVPGLMSPGVKRTTEIIGGPSGVLAVNTSTTGPGLEKAANSALITPPAEPKPNAAAAAAPAPNAAAVAAVAPAANAAAVAPVANAAAVAPVANAAAVAPVTNAVAVAPAANAAAVAPVTNAVAVAPAANAAAVSANPLAADPVIAQKLNESGVDSATVELPADQTPLKVETSSTIEVIPEKVMASMVDGQLTLTKPPLNVQSGGGDAVPMTLPEQGAVLLPPGSFIVGGKVYSPDTDKEQVIALAKQARDQGVPPKSRTKSSLMRAKGKMGMEPLGPANAVLDPNRDDGASVSALPKQSISGFPLLALQPGQMEIKIPRTASFEFANDFVIFGLEAGEGVTEPNEFRLLKYDKDVPIDGEIDNSLITEADGYKIKINQGKFAPTGTVFVGGLLFASGSKKFERPETTELITAIRTKSVEQVNALLDAGKDVNEVTAAGTTPLSEAIMTREGRIISRLLNVENINVPANKILSLMKLAIELDDIPMLDVLHRKFSKNLLFIDIKNNFIVLALTMNKPAIAMKLIELGYKATIPRREDNKSAADIAADLQMQGVVAMLDSKGIFTTEKMQKASEAGASPAALELAGVSPAPAAAEATAAPAAAEATAAPAAAEATAAPAAAEATAAPAAAEATASAPVANASAPVANASAPVANASAPVANASAPVANASAPVANASAPVANASAPVVNASAPVANASAPVANASAPVANASAPVANASAPVANASAPVANASAPVANASAPVANASAPVANASAPVANASAPVANASAPVANASAPVANASAPVTNASAPVTNASAPVANAAQIVEEGVKNEEVRRTPPMGATTAPSTEVPPIESAASATTESGAEEKAGEEVKMSESEMADAEKAKAIAESEKGAQAGGYRPTARNRKTLKKYRRGESIGFTATASLKAKGLIPRTSRKNKGKKMVSNKYK